MPRPTASTARTDARASSEWAQMLGLCPNPTESPANGREPRRPRRTRVGARFRRTVPDSRPSTRIPRPACHAEGRGFESHHPLEAEPRECGAFCCGVAIGDNERPPGQVVGLVGQVPLPREPQADAQATRTLGQVPLSSDLDFTRGESRKLLEVARSPASALPARPSGFYRCASSRRCRNCGRTR
jgi:hypothetical protein